MKIYVSHSRELDFKKELYEPLRKSQLNTDHEIILPHEVYEETTDFVTRDIIKTCDVMIAEVSFPSTGSGIELGWADGCGCSIVCAYQKGSRTSGSLKVACSRFIEYSNQEELVEKLGKVLAESCSY